MICTFVSVGVERLRNAALKDIGDKVSTTFYPAIKILSGLTKVRQINAYSCISQNVVGR